MVFCRSCTRLALSYIHEAFEWDLTILSHIFYACFFFLGEGFHNYHHTFPFDYATSEFGCKLNLTTAFIDFMCFLGLARDRKRVSKDTVLARVQRTGDGSYKSG